MRYLPAGILCLLAIGLGVVASTPPLQRSTLGQIERHDPRLDELIPPGAVIEVLAEGFEWAEGPVWIPSERALLFSDIPNNVVLRWKEGEGISEFLKPSGYTGDGPPSPDFSPVRDGGLISALFGRTTGRFQAHWGG